MAALSANLVGIGLARFGYTPLIPALIAAGWFAPSAAVYLGAANLAGYLAGAIGARAVAARTGTPALLRGSMLATAASLLACALPLGFAWFFLWRFLSGGTGGMLMALAAPSVMPGIPVARRGLAPFSFCSPPRHWCWYWRSILSPGSLPTARAASGRRAG